MGLRTWLVGLGTGIFKEGAQLVITFAFKTIGVRRLEARAAAKNDYGDEASIKLGAVNKALVTLGAVQVGIFRKEFLRNGEYLDQVLRTLLGEDWQAKVIWGGGKIH